MKTTPACTTFARASPNTGDMAAYWKPASRKADGDAAFLAKALGDIAVPRG